MRYLESNEKENNAISKEKRDLWWTMRYLENNNIYRKYYNEALNNNKVYFGGRLAEYKYYDMHQVIQKALETVKTYNIN